MELRPPRRWPWYLACLLVGMLLGWWMRRPVQVVERAAPAVVLPSGGHVLERKPEAQVPPAVTTAAKESGGKLVRAGSVTVRPHGRVEEVMPPEQSRRHDSAPVAQAPVCTCADVQLDWGLLRFGDGQRMVFSTDDGEILDGVDIPMVPMLVPREPRWSAMLLVEPAERKAGALVVTRAAGPFTLAAAIVRVHGDTVPMVGAGFRF